MRVCILTVILSLSGCLSTNTQKSNITAWDPMEATKAASIPRKYNICENTEDCAREIAGVIQENWYRNPGACLGLVSQFSIELNASFEVVGIEVVELSDSAAFNWSAVRAIRSSSPFTELQGLPEKEFLENFKQFQFMFRPEDVGPCKK